MRKNSGKPRKKKAFGQHFLRKQSVVDHMIERVVITGETSVLEIGCGDGFLTKSILTQSCCKRLLSYEIDPEWANFVRDAVQDKRLEVKLENVLDADFTALEPEKPWVLLANLPYQVTFPIFFLIQRHKSLFEEGVVMIQEEVAQKIVARRGKKYGVTSIFLQHHFSFELMEKVEPEAFSPPPKVTSRLLYLKPRYDAPKIPEEEKFWKFVKLCFRFPRQTLRNNLKATHYDYEQISQDILKLRAQQLVFADLLDLWRVINSF